MTCISQLETNPIHAVTIMTVLQEGGSAKDALAEAIKQDGKFLDGNDASARQIGVVSFKGNAAAHTGETAGQYAGHRADGFVSVQGNGLVSKDVLTAMWDCFHNTDGSLDERLLTALEAGYAEGGHSPTSYIEQMKGLIPRFLVRIKMYRNILLSEKKKNRSASFFGYFFGYFLDNSTNVYLLPKRVVNVITSYTCQ